MQNLRNNSKGLLSTHKVPKVLKFYLYSLMQRAGCLCQLCWA